MKTWNLTPCGDSALSDQCIPARNSSGEHMHCTAVEEEWVLLLSSQRKFLCLLTRDRERPMEREGERERGSEIDIFLLWPQKQIPAFRTLAVLVAISLGTCPDLLRSAVPPCEGSTLISWSVSPPCSGFSVQLRQELERYQHAQPLAQKAPVLILIKTMPNEFSPNLVPPTLCEKVKPSKILTTKFGIEHAN